MGPSGRGGAGSHSPRLSLPWQSEGTVGQLEAFLAAKADPCLVFWEPGGHLDRFLDLPSFQGSRFDAPLI